jgi:hypothetical protein
MSDLRPYSRESRMYLMKLFLARNTFEISGLPEIFRSESGKNPPRAEVFPAREKNLP